jgi:GTP-binding protein EngB required for normal cell division
LVHAGCDWDWSTHKCTRTKWHSVELVGLVTLQKEAERLKLTNQTLSISTIPIQKMSSIIKYRHHQGRINEITTRYPQFSRIRNASVIAPHLQWRDTSNGNLSHHMQVAFFGKSGYGKSSTVNSFFGESALETSAIDACTRRCDSLDFELAKNSYLSLADFPGIGESEYRDKEYLQMYAEFLSLSTVVVYVLRADQRDLAIDEFAYKTVFRNAQDKEKVIFALNCCDKIEPISRSQSTEPSPEQHKNISIKVKSINQIFKPINPIVPYSAETGWNMSQLAHEIVEKITKVDSHYIVL